MSEASGSAEIMRLLDREAVFAASSRPQKHKKLKGALSPTMGIQSEREERQLNGAVPNRVRAMHGPDNRYSSSQAYFRIVRPLIYRHRTFSKFLALKLPPLFEPV
jgi:hypothetical protein